MVVDFPIPRHEVAMLNEQVISEISVDMNRCNGSFAWAVLKAEIDPWSNVHCRTHFHFSSMDGAHFSR